MSNTEHYVKLVFSRDLNLPNLDEIKRLEQEVFSLPYPNYPSAFGCLMVVGLVILFIAVASAIGESLVSMGAQDSASAIGVVLGLISVVCAYIAYIYYMYLPKKQAADQMMAKTNERERELLAAVAQYDR